MRNEIIIEGKRHVFRSGNGGFYPCRRCSLHAMCGNESLCEKIYKQRGTFELYQRKEK